MMTKALLVVAVLLVPATAHAAPPRVSDPDLAEALQALYSAKGELDATEPTYREIETALPAIHSAAAAARGRLGALAEDIEVERKERSDFWGTVNAALPFVAPFLPFTAFASKTVRDVVGRGIRARSAGVDFEPAGPRYRARASVPVEASSNGAASNGRYPVTA